MPWRVADSLLQLRKQIDELAPARKKASDGTIGDARHKSRDSDHNAWIEDGKINIVSAMDITHDPQNGVDCDVIADNLVRSRDPRIKYIIWDRRICSSITRPWEWRNYTGSNPHDKHIHISVKPSKNLYDSKATWGIGKIGSPNGAVKAPVIERPLLKKGIISENVKILQKMLGIRADGNFGPKTKEAVEAFQKANGLVPDGIVGLYTWEKLEEKEE